MANETACALNMMDHDEAERIKSLLQRYGLPVSYIISDIDKFYNAFFLDKKSTDASITFILPKHIGGVGITDDVDPSVIRSVLSEYRS